MKRKNLLQEEAGDRILNPQRVIKNALGYQHSRRRDNYEYLDEIEEEN